MPAGAAYGNQADRKAGKPGGNKSGQGSQGGSTGASKSSSGPKGYVGPSDAGLKTAGMQPSGLAGRLKDASNKDNSTLDDIGNFIASMFGFNEQKPKTSYSTKTDTTWGFDPAGLIGSMVGMATGVPVIGGILADQISKYAGRPLEIGLGEDVLGGVSLESAIMSKQLGSASGTTSGTGKAVSAGGERGSRGNGPGAGHTTPSVINATQPKAVVKDPGKTTPPVDPQIAEIDKLMQQLMNKKFVPPTAYTMDLSAQDALKKAILQQNGRA